MGRKSREKKERRTGAAQNHSTLEQHQRVGKQLTPPLMQIEGMKPISWLDDRLPEMLWAALLISALGRDWALGIFRATIQWAREREANGFAGEPMLSDIATWPEQFRDEFLRLVCEAPEARAALRPLLLFEELPGRAAWEQVIADMAQPQDWDGAASAVLLVLDHQSQEATDCRWVRVMFQLASGRLGMPRELLKELLNYPQGPLEMIRPMIRATEGALTMGPDRKVSEWPSLFWSQCLRDTPCRHLADRQPRGPAALGTTREIVSAVQEALVAHENRSRTTTTVDARHEALFGFAAYALSMLDELMRMGNSGSVLGRMGLRSLLEMYLTMAFLAGKDDPELWVAYRNYGSGQAKLAFLKLGNLQEGEAPFVDLDTLERLANEDRWLEFVGINLGNWNQSNLRQLSETVGEKAEYDRYYDWTSAFVHSNWAAVRNVVFDLCANPLHRLHRILRPMARTQEDVIPDACRIVDKVLGLLDEKYPGFQQRVTLNDQR